MKRRIDSRLCCVGLFLAVASNPAGGILGQVGSGVFRLDVEGGRPTGTSDGLTTWEIDVPDPPPACVDVEVALVLVSNLEPCASQPKLCDGGEQPAAPANQDGMFGCADGRDNDDDGWTDGEDPDCVGINGWTASVTTDLNFNLSDTSVAGTVSDLRESPPGLREFSSFYVTRSVDPFLNAGQEGVTSAVTYSNQNPVFLPPVGEHTVLKLFGSISTAVLGNPGDRTKPSILRIPDPGGPGLFSSIGSTLTRLTLLDGTALVPEVLGASIELVLAAAPTVSFLRGDADGSGSLQLNDGIVVLNFLFLGDSEPECLDAADADDNGVLELNDGVATFNFLFLGAEPPAPPGPLVCGDDPTPDPLGCTAFAACPKAPGNAVCERDEIDDTLFCSRFVVDGARGASALGDFNGDGLLDLVTDSPAELTVSLHLNNGFGALDPPEPLDFIPQDIRSMAAGDLDADGSSDFVAVGEGLVAFINGGRGAFVIIDDPEAPAMLTAVLDDFDGDGFADVAGGTPQGDVVVLLGLGNGTFVIAHTVPLSADAAQSSLTSGDFDGDLLPDLAVSFRQASSGPGDGVWVLRNEGGGSFAAPAQLIVDPGPRAVEAAHLDGDGVLDLAVLAGQNDLFTFLGRGAEGFAEPDRLFVADEDSCRRFCGGAALAAADLDGDGDADIVLGTRLNHFAVLLGDGEGKFEVEAIHPSGMSMGAFAIGDVVGDGGLEVVVSTSGAPVHLFSPSCSPP